MEMLVRYVIINILNFLYEEDAPFLPAYQMDPSALIEQNTQFHLHTAPQWLLMSACISNAPWGVCRESE